MSTKHIISLWSHANYEQSGSNEGNHNDRPIGLITVQLPSKTRLFKLEFREPSRVRSTESSGFMERAIKTKSARQPKSGGVVHSAVHNNFVQEVLAMT